MDLGLYRKSGTTLTLAEGTKHSLQVAPLNKTDFNSQPLTFLLYNLQNTAAGVQVWDLRTAGSTGTNIPLDNLKGGTYASGVYETGMFSWIIPGDTNFDGKTNLADYIFVQGMQGFTGRTSADLGRQSVNGISGKGLPDGIVKSVDELYAWENMGEEERAGIPKPVLPPSNNATPTDPINPSNPGEEGYLIYDFESGKLPPGWMSYQAKPWHVTSEMAHSGSYSLSSGTGDTSLLFTTQGSGKADLWRKTTGGEQIIYNNGRALNRGYGEQDWKQFSLPIEVGANNFEFQHRGGVGITYIDDVRIPVAGAQSLTSGVPNRVPQQVFEYSASGWPDQPACLQTMPSR